MRPSVSNFDNSIPPDSWVLLSRTTGFQQSQVMFSSLPSAPTRPAARNNGLAGPAGRLAKAAAVRPLPAPPPAAAAPAVPAVAAAALPAVAAAAPIEAVPLAVMDVAAMVLAAAVLTVD